MTYLSELSFINVLDLLGTFAFAISGIRLASVTKMDWFGAYVIGLVTAIGGGTTRDLLLDVKPVWMEDPTYIIVTGVALVAFILFQQRIYRIGITLFLFDTIGLGLFTVTGISKSMDLGLPVWTCIIMGTITGCIGGVVRDIIINEVPLLFRKDIYAMACVAGGVVYFACLAVTFLQPFSEVIAVSVVILFRILAAKFHLQLPQLIYLDEDR